MHVGQKYINEDKVSYFKALTYENKNCQQFPAFDDEATETEVSMEIEEAQGSDDECPSEDFASQRQGELDFLFEKANQRQKKLSNGQTTTVSREYECDLKSHHLLNYFNFLAFIW